MTDALDDPDHLVPMTLHVAQHAKGFVKQVEMIDLSTWNPRTDPLPGAVLIVAPPTTDLWWCEPCLECHDRATYEGHKP